LVTRLEYVLVSKMICRRVLSPTASSDFSSGAFVQPHPGTTFRIFSVSSPVENSQNECEIVEFCGTYPKSKSDSGIVSRGAPQADPATSAAAASPRHVVLSLVMFVV